MVAVIMVAEASGSGRGTLFEILRLLFGKTYVTPCTFGKLKDGHRARASTTGSPTRSSPLSTKRTTRTGICRLSGG
jgi:hypothetical protein